ncbi:MAG: hypothetical protein HY566_00675, partial [Candidatus Kerfeldbacteria bacterium]|nr:hypothetical protein [Candidatus Kerfeldbacteria bacterium]
VGLWPSPAVCGVPGSTWHDTQIVIEVPNKSTASPADDVVNPGPLEVLRGTDGISTVSTDLFTPVAGPPRPGICAVDPPGGTPSITIAKIWGQNFGTSQTAGTDRAVFYDLQDVPPADTPFWSETRIEARVPLNAANAPPSPAPEDGKELVVENDGLQSNAVNFDVLPIGCTTCTVDTSCAAGGTTEGCGRVGPFQCCISRPTVSAAAPTGSNVCRNAAITFSFVDAVTALPKAMDLSTITPSTVHLFNVTDSAAVTLGQNQIGFPSNHSVEIAPGLLGRNKQYRLTISGDNDLTDGVAQGVLSTDRIGLNGDTSWVFTSADEDNYCRIGFVQLDPGAYSFTALGATENTSARAYDTDGTTQIMPISGIYDWTWQWGTDQATIASVTNTNAPLQTLTANSKGETILNLTAQAGTGWTGSRTARARVVVDACNSPWPAVAPPLIDDPAHYPARSKHTNFSTWYCRDEGSLPALNIIEQEGAVASNGVDEKLREFFFENPNVNPATSKKDAIGILVWENEKELSAPAWYRKIFKKSVGAATSKIDGYDAMRVGTTLYIAGTNLAGGTLYTNIYVLGYNEDAGPDTVAIFNQMLAKLRLNANESDFVYGSTDALTARDQVRLDMRRKSNMNDYVGALVAYNAKKGTFPKLDAGSYINGISTSRWPSWVATLGGELLANVPDLAINAVDPVNTFSSSPTPCSAVPGFDAETCWNEATKSFVCPAGSHVYGYRSTDGTWFNLYARFDYEGTGTWSTGPANLCDAADGPVAPASCSAQCFNYRFHGTPSTVVGIPASMVPERSGTGGSVAGATVPAAPQHVAAKAGGADAVTVTWDVVSDEADVRLYRVVRSGEDGVPTTVAQTRHPSSSYTDTTVKAGKRYAYTVTANDYFGGVSSASDPAVVVVPESGDALPPRSVSDVSVALQGKQLVFFWKNPDDQDFGGVLILRKAGAVPSFRQDDEGVETVVDLKPTTTTSLRNSSEPPEPVTYGLFAYDHARNVAPGAFVTRGVDASKLAERTEPLAPVKNIAAVATERGVLLSWLLPDDQRITGVLLRRSSQPMQSATDGEPVATIPTPQSSYTDTAARTESRTWYAAFSTNAAGEISESAITDIAGNAASGDVHAFRARAGDGYVLLTWERVRASATDRMVIRRSSSAFPASPDDGELVAVLSPGKEGSSTDRTVRNGATYYYTAFLGMKGRGFAKARPEKSMLSLSVFRIPPNSIETERAVIRWTTNVPATTVVQIGTSPNYEVGSFMLGDAVTDHEWDSALFGLRLAPNTPYHVRALSSDSVGGRVASADRVFVTDLRAPDGRLWQGYDETLTAASWNGSRDANTCDAACNQYYRCSADGTPDCSDLKNGSEELPGASTMCGAIAYADCLDGRVDLPQGKKVLTPAVLRGWEGSRLPLRDEYAAACTSSAAPTGMPYPKGVWAANAPEQPDRASVAGANADGVSCRATSADTLGTIHSLMILTPSP